MDGQNLRRCLRHEYGVAIVCPLFVEMNVIRYMLDDEHEALPQVEGDNNRYIYGSLSGHNVVIGFLPEGSQGTGVAARVATNMKRTFPQIKLRLLVGIGGGIPSKQNDVRLGDVVISTPDGIHGGVVQYDMGKETMSGFARKGYLEQPPEEWRAAIPLMRSDHSTKDNKILQFIETMIQKYPKLRKNRHLGPGSDMLFDPRSAHTEGEATCGNCDHSALVIRRDRNSINPVIHYGTIASGNRVIKNASKRDKISADAGGALCVEMEAAGLMSDFKCVVIRGICDYADSHKNDDWQSYAAAAAAGCAKELLTYMTKITEEIYENIHFVVPKQRVQPFIGREEELREIEMHFYQTQTQLPRTVVIQALGGQGKSQLALEFCYRKRRFYHSLFWINASSEQTIVQSLVRIAQTAGLERMQKFNDDEAKADAVLQELSRRTKRWLLVFDNCDDPKMFASIRRFIPSAGNGDLIFTTRHRGLERLGTMLELPSMPKHDALAMLLRHYNKSDREKATVVAEKIVQRLGGLALAIDQAAAYIQYQELPANKIENFLASYENRREHVLQHVPDDLWEYGVMRADSLGKRQAISAFTTWELSLQYLYPEKEEYQEASVQLLTLSASLAPIPITEDLFSNYWNLDRTIPKWMFMFCELNDPHHCPGDKLEEDTLGHGDGGHRWSPDKFWHFIQQARRLSLIQAAGRKLNESPCEFSLHPLIRDWLELRLVAAQRTQNILDGIRLISASIPAYRRDSTPYEIKSQLMLHMDVLLNHKIPGTSSGRREQHRRFLDWRFETRIDWDCYEFAEYYRLLGRDESAMSIYQCGLEASRRLFGPKHIFVTQWSLARTPILINREEYKQLEALCRSIVEMQETNSSEGKILVVAALEEQARALEWQGKTLAAVEAEREVLATCQRLLGFDDKGITLKTMSEVARRLGNLGRADEAIKIHHVVLEQAKRTLNFDRTTIFGFETDLLRTLTSSSRTEEAISLGTQMWEQTSHLLGSTTEVPSEYWAAQAPVLELRGMFDEAERIYRMLVNLKSAALGADHLDVLGEIMVLTRMLRRTQKFVDAEGVLRAALQAREGWEQRDAWSQVAILSLATVLVEQTRYNEGWDMYQSVFSQIHGDAGRHTVLLQYISSFGVSLKDAQQFEQAQNVFEFLIPVNKDILGMNSAQTILDMAMLAKIYLRQKELVKADLIFGDIVDLAPLILREDDDRNLEILFYWATMPMLMVDPSSAEYRLGIARQRLQQVVQPDNEWSLLITSDLALVLADIGKRHEAEQLTLELYSTIRKMLKTCQPGSIDILNDVVELLQRFGRTQQAHEISSWSESDCERCVSPESSDVD